jgi:exopolyphosphatase/pppGpp-phosphohydrolase
MNALYLRQIFWILVCCLSLTAVRAQEVQAPIVYDGYRGGFDIGSQGVKLSVIGFYHREGKLKYKLVYDRQETVGLVKGMEINNGKLRPSDVQDAVATVQEMLKDASETFGMAPRDFIIYTSSGVNLAANVADVDAMTQKQLGIPTTTNMPTKVEATYSVRSGLAREDFDRAILVDVGGGNLKGGILQPYVSASGAMRYTFKAYTIEHGARRVAERVLLRQKDPLMYQSEVRRMVEDSISPLMRMSLNDNPEIKTVGRSIIYLTGGAAYQFVTWRFPEKVQEEIVEFSLNDFNQFIDMLSSPTGWLDWSSKTFTKVEDPKLRELMERDHAKATRKVYNREGCLAGALLAQQMFREIGNLNTKTFYFTRDAYWINALVFDTYKGEFKSEGAKR